MWLLFIGGSITMVLIIERFWGLITSDTSRRTLHPVYTVSETLFLRSWHWPLDDDAPIGLWKICFIRDEIRIMRNDLCPIIRRFTGNSPRKALPLHYFGQNTVWKPALLTKSHIWVHNSMITNILLKVTFLATKSYILL